MKTFVRAFLAVGLLSAPAHALAESERGPFFVEGHVLGAALALPEGGVGVSYPVEVGFGYHVFGTHEGLVLGAVQRFDIGLSGGGASGATTVRVGWDIAIPLDPMELTIAPYAQGGVFYAFAGGDPGGWVGAGVEARLFPFPVAKTVDGKAPVRTKRVEVRANQIEIGEKIQFKVNEDVIESVSDSLLQEIADVINGNPQIRKLRIEGHASSDGDANANRALSEARAKAVREHLVSRGKVDASRLDSEGFGSDKPLDSNDSEEGREKNRRVEFNILEQDATVTKVVERRGGGPEEGFFIVAKPIEVDLAISGDLIIPVLSFQAGAGIAF
jgi:outer membrane protein OmpA-like peptidoglycan-associated protein